MPELPRNLPHLYLAGSGKAEPFTTKLRPRGRPLPQRERAVHAEAVRLALAGAMAAAAVERGEREPDILTGTPGFYLDFELTVGSEDAAERLENRRKHIELVAVRPESGDSPARATVFVPDTAADHFLRRVDEYRDENTRTGKPKNEATMLILIIILLLVFGGGGGYYGHSRWGFGGGAGVGLGTILLILLIVYMLGMFPMR